MCVKKNCASPTKSLIARHWTKVDLVGTMTFFFGGGGGNQQRTRRKVDQPKNSGTPETNFAPLRTTFYLRHCTLVTCTENHHVF